MRQESRPENDAVPTTRAAEAPPSTPEKGTGPTREIAAGSVLRGRGVSPGQVAARVVHLAPPLPEPDPDTVVAEADRDSEVSAIEWAAVAVADQLRSRTAQATGETKAILDASRLLASDPELVSEATALVRSKGRSAARAVWETAVVHEKALAALGGRMAERIADIRDESSDRTGQRLVVVLKRDAVAKVVLNNLYKHTQLQENFGANMLAIVDGVPRTLAIDGFITHWISHQIDVIVRRTEFRLREAEKRMHILRGYLKALDALDEVIALIRASATVDDAREGLMELLDVDDHRARARQRHLGLVFRVADDGVDLVAARREQRGEWPGRGLAI